MKLAIIGFGARGSLYAELYGKDAELTAVCDIKSERCALAKETHGLSNKKIFLSDDGFFAAGKLADLLVVSTPDALHKKHALAALNIGYDLQLEKPIACTEEECREIYETAKRLGRKVFVCHVLRYAPFFAEIKKELDSGAYGKISTINLTENVAYWHQAHSYVRGNWRRADTSSPMIIAKSCHDLDIIAWLIQKRCKTVSSMGSLGFFTSANAPENSGERCLTCQVKSDCAYNAEEFYLGKLREGNNKWPVNVLATQPTEQNITKALESEPYGKCVFKCDNDAVDHQIVNMEFEDRITAHLTMTAFSKDSYREIHVHCEKGEIYGNMLDNMLNCNIFGKSSKTIDVNHTDEGNYGHGGGDLRMVKDIIKSYAGDESRSLTTIDHSIISHFIGFAAEKSRLKSGEVAKLD